MNSYCAIVPRPPGLPLLAGGVLIALQAATMGSASAQSRTIQSFSVSTELEHDSNPRLAPGDAPSTTWLRRGGRDSSSRMRKAAGWCRG